MKNRTGYWIKSVALLVMILLTNGVNAAVEDFQLSVRNLQQTAPNRIEFDVFLLDTDTGQPFEMASCQLGFLINSLIYTGGTLSVSIDNTGSGLNALQQFTAAPSVVSTLSGYPNQTLIRLAAGAIVGPGSGTIISTSGFGTLLTHFIITSNTVDFVANSQPNIVFNASTSVAPLYPTRVAEFISSISTQLVVTPGTNAIVDGNPILNPPAPVAYDVTGGGAYCEGGSGVEIGLSNSEIGVTYTLVRGTTDLTPTAAGTDSPISFGLQTIEGTYTVRGTNAGGNTTMNGNAVVTVTPLPTVPTALAGSGATCNQITSNWTTVTGATSYQLDVSTSNTFATFVTGYQNRDVGNVTSHNITGLVTGTTYYYRVRAVNSCGVSGNSGTITYATLAVPAQPGTITGPTNPCPGTSGLAYEVAAVTGATSYTWTVPSGWAINSGQSTRAISVTSGTSGGTISVYASNACGDGTARTLTVSVGTNSTAPTGVTISNNNTCNGTSKTLIVTGGTLGTGAVWEWFTGSCGGTTAGTGASITVDPAAGSSTTYYVRASGTCNVTACASGTVVVPDNVTIPSTPVPSATTICQGTPSITVSTSATNATSYIWTVSGTGNTVSGTGSTATVNFSPTFSGVATIGVSANGCGGPTTVVSTTVTVRPTPTASISGSTTVCQNSPSPSITFTNPQTLPVTVTYNINGSNEANINVAASSNATLVVPTTAANTFVYNLVSVTYQTAPTCSSSLSGSATVTVNPTPVVANQTESITTGSTFTVTPSGVPGGTTYTWPAPTYTNGVTGGVAQPTGVSSISGTLTIPSGSGTATYTVTPRTGTCVGNTFTLTVTVTSTCEPVVITSDPSDAGICAGGSTTFSVTATGTTPAYQWQYYNGASWVSVSNGTPAGAVYTNATTATLSVSGITAAGSYQYRCNATNCSVSSDQSATAILTVNAIPVQPTLTVTQPTCSTATGTINISAPTGAGMTYSIDGTTYTNTTGIFTGVVPGSYNVTARSSAGCTSPIRIATVNDQPPTPVIGNQTASINSGQTFNITPTGAPVGTTYTWPAPTYTNGVTGGVAQSTGVSSISGTLTIPSGSGTAVYTVTPTAGACVGNPFTVTVTVSSSCIPVVITSDPSGASICAGGSTSFSVTATGTTPAYQWQYYNGTSWVSVSNGTPAGAVYTNATTATLSVSGITAAGSYQYRCNATNCSVSSDQSNAATLTVNAIPTQPTVTITQPTCSTATGTITVTSPTGAGMTYSIDGTTYTNTTGVFVSVAPGTYTVTARSSAGCTSPGRSATVNDQPPTPVVGNQTASINSGQTFTVTPTGVPVGTTYTWPAPTYTNGVTGGVAQPTGVSSISGTLTIPSGSGTATYTVTPRTGTCVGNTFTLTVTVTSTCEPVVITSDPSDAGICAGGSTTFSVTATGTTPAYQWQYYNGASWVSVSNGTPAGAVYTNATTATLSVSGITAAGSYQYRCNATNCSVSSDQSATAILTVNAIPVQPTLTVTQPTCSTATGTINISAPTGAGMTYSIDGTTYTNTTGIFTGVVPGSYNVTARSSAGCTSPIRIATVNDQPPTPVIGNQTASINSGQTFNITPTGAPVGTTYTWPAPTYTNGVTGGVAQSTGVSSISGTLTIPSGSGTAVYTVTPTAGACVGNPFTVTVTVSSSCIPVVITSDPSGASICAGGSTSFSVTATGTTPAYQWQYYNGTSWVSVANGTPAGAVYTNTTTATLGVSGITAAGSYQYRCNATNCSVSNDQSNAAILTVNALPAQPAITADGLLSICDGEDVVLTSTEATTYEWSTGATTRSITVTTAGNYNVRVTNAAGCQSVWSGTTVVTVNPLPSRPTITPSGTVGICSGSSRTLTSSLGTTYLWSNGETTQSISASAAGTYTVQVTNSYGCLSQPSLATTVIVNPLPATPVITASGPTAICAGSSVTLTSSVSTSYLWSTGATTRSISISTAGDYWVRVSDANGCQSAQSAITAVTVNPLPAAPTVGTLTQPTCSVATGSVALSGLPATGNWTLTRNTGGTEIAGSGTTYTVTGLPAGTHTFTVTNVNGCTSSASAPVVINTPPAVPTAPVTGTVTQPTCAVTTGSVGISGLPSSGTWTLTRNPGGTEVSGTGITYTLSGIPAGTYTFTVTNASGCVSPASASITVTAPLPVPTAPIQTVNCDGGFNHAVITISSPTGTGYEYRLNSGTWQTSNIFSDVANGNYTITVRNSSGCTTTGELFSINCGCVNPPLLTLSATSGSTCGVTAVTVAGNTFGGSATSITVTENGGGMVTPSSSTSSPFNFTYTPVAGDAGRVIVITVTTNNPLGTPCSAASATYSLTVNANPVAPVPGTVTNPTCSLPTGSVVLNSLPATGDWTVTRNPGGQTTNGSGTSTTISGLSPGTYTFTVTNSNGCVSAASTNVVVNAQPDTPTAPVVGAITQPTCALSTGSVALSGLPATGNWTLTRMPGNITLSGSGTTRTVSAIPPGTYTFTVANAAGCISSASVEAIINVQPVTPSAPIIGTITHPTCELATGSIVIENMPEFGEWTLIRYPGGTSSTGTGSSVTISSLPAGTYNFAVRNADGCTSPVSANAVINAQPPTPSTPVVGTITHPTFLVATGSVVLSGLPASGTWTLIRYPDGFTSQGTGTTRTVSGLEPGTYSFAVTNFVGCTSATTADVVINARPGAPVVVINNPPTICENETTDLTLAAVTAGSDANLTFTYWTDSEATVEYTTPLTASSGTYYIKGTSTAGYYTIKSVVVTADALPVAYAGADQVLEYVFGATLDADIPDVGSGLWELVTGTGNIFNPVDPATSVSGLSAGENVFSWTVSNGACDPVSDLVVITVNNLTVPTLITPNLDGRNDYFVLRGLGTLGRTGLTIFDRRGMKVYENSDYQNDWDGTDYNSNPLPDDTYFYVIRADNGVSLSGYIVVRR